VHDVSTPVGLEPVVRDYFWGSRTVLAELRGGTGPSPGPEAEAWFGAHPAAPSQVAGGDTTLLELIDRDPVAALGEDVANRFDGRLPFLVKLLAADQPLSLQAHPSAEQARRGFAAEERSGVPRDTPTRTYRDAWPKPELLHALTRTTALCGFREPSATIALLDDLHVPVVAPLRAALAERGEAALPSLLSEVLRERPPAGELAALGRAARRLVEQGGPRAREATWIIELLERYPGDGGVLVALLLRVIDLEPGQAVYLPAGNLHAYLRGAGVEVMASSDNVVRGGLTSKHIDVEELLQVVDARVLPPPLVTCETDGPVARFPSPSPYFALERIGLFNGHEVSLDRASRGPEIILALGGDVRLRSRGRVVDLARGGGAFVPAVTEHLSISGSASAFRVTVGPDRAAAPTPAD
jgi:mannose-6-phosphate isomerase